MYQNLFIDVAKLSGVLRERRTAARTNPDVVRIVMQKIRGGPYSNYEKLKTYPIFDSVFKRVFGFGFYLEKDGDPTAALFYDVVQLVINTLRDKMDADGNMRYVLYHGNKASSFKIRNTTDYADQTWEKKEGWQLAVLVTKEMRKKALCLV